MKRLFLILALVLSAVVLLSPAKASASSDWYCTVPNQQDCVGGWNYWNHHYVKNLGSSVVYCAARQPNGAQQGYAWVYGGQEKTISGWNYNRIVCNNVGGSQTTLHIISY